MTPLDARVTRSDIAAAAYILDQHSLLPYHHFDETGTEVLEAVIYGQSRYRDLFLQNIFSVAQIPGAILRLYIIAVDSWEYLERLLRENPLLEKTTHIYIDGERYENAKLDNNITSVPFAELHFYGSVECFWNNCRAGYPRYYLLVDQDGNRNRKTAANILIKLSDSVKDTYIAYVDNWEKTSRIRTWGEICAADESVPACPENVIIQPFNCEAFRRKADRILRRAFDIHCYYSYEFDERQSLKQLKQSFYDKTNGWYNLRSSLRSALSIAYKLTVCGLQQSTDPAAEFNKRVLRSKSKKAEKLLGKLICMEHRSWICSLIVDGWNYPTWEELTNYAFQNGNDHRDRKRKLHPCLCETTEAFLSLQKISRQEWGSAKEPDDRLNNFSLFMHRLCQEKAEKLETEPLFTKLKQCLQLRDLPEDCYSALGYLSIACRKAIYGETNANHVWKDACKLFEQKITQAGADDGQLWRAYREICEGMRAVLERNLYHDYKESDLTILRAIPRVLVKRPIRTIYKPVSSQLWNNVISGLVVMPERLILVSDHQQKVDNETLRLIQDFYGRRGLQSVKVSVEPLKQIDCVHANAVVDITGASPEMVSEILRNSRLKRLPQIVERQGGLRGVGGFQDIVCYDQRKSLTVGETFSLAEADFYNEDSENLVLGLSENYQALWHAYLAIQSSYYGSGFPWHILIDYLKEQRNKQYCQLEPGKDKTGKRFSRSNAISSDLFQETGLSDVFADLCRLGYVAEYQENTQDGTISYITHRQSVADALEKAVNAAEKRECRFRILLFNRDPVRDAPLDAPQYYLVDECLTVDAAFKNVTLTPAKGGRNFDKAKVLADCLRILSSEKILSPKGKQPLLQEDKGGFYRVCFRYHSMATRECLQKQGNVLEAYVYHTLRQSGYFDDIRMNVGVLWRAQRGPHKSALERGAVTNEIDIICTKGLRTVFISCKQSDIQNEFLNEIAFETQQFGIEAKAIIVCSHPNVVRGIKSGNDTFVYRSNYMNVSLIDSTYLDGKDPSRNLVKKIESIVEGDEN